MISKYPKRHWGLRGKPNSGKSTFLAANAERPLYIIDADGRFDFVSGLAEGDVIFPDNKKGNVLPLDIQEQAESNVILSDVDVKSIGVDSVTQIFNYQSRVASLRGNLSADQRKRRKLGTNKASDMVDKSNAMAVLRTIASFGTHVFYIWHLTEGRDHQGTQETRDVISKVELERLHSTMAVILDFAHDRDGFYVTVTWARDLNGRPANTGFTLQDTPDNFWRGGALRLEKCVYTAFDTEKEAIEWAMKIRSQAFDEIEAHWKDVTRKHHEWPVKVAMFVDDIYSRLTQQKQAVQQKKQPPQNGQKEQPSLWATVEVGTAVKVNGKNGLVDGLFKGIDGELIKVEVDGKSYNVAPERVSVPEAAEVRPGSPDEEVSPDDWERMQAEIDAARKEEKEKAA